MNNRVSTSEITKTCEYFDSPSDFFKNFPEAWSNLKSKVLKLETRQIYDETGNQSYDTLVTKGLDESIELIPSVRECDVDLYNELKLKNIDFIRCRPVKIPLTLYLRWEFECYVFNSNHGEQIYCLDYEKNESIFTSQAQHDFMVFDETIAFIHDYDKTGHIQGGWKVESKKNIISLIKLFNSINTKSIIFSDYLKTINYKCKLKFKS